MPLLIHFLLKYIICEIQITRITQQPTNRLILSQDNRGSHIIKWLLIDNNNPNSNNPNIIQITAILIETLSSQQPSSSSHYLQLQRSIQRVPGT